jgi:hypothetical protein
VPELGPLGSVRGASSNGRPYREDIASSSDGPRIGTLEWRLRVDGLLQKSTTRLASPALMSPRVWLTRTDAVTSADSPVVDCTYQR